MRHPMTSFVLLAGFLVVSFGCSTPQEVARITDRPAAAPLVSPGRVVLPSSPEPGTEVIVQEAPDIEVGRFDYGKMWTFDHPPIDYFEEAYGFRPDSTWFNRARLGALRFSTYCSASFVSPSGLVMTNHHCGRESVAEVSRPDENLLDNGFFAGTGAEERKVKDLYVDQLIAIEDVTARIYRASEVVRGDNEKMQARQQKSDEIAEQMTDAAQSRDSTLTVEVVELYNGGRYAAYTFRRYKDVRLVMAPEHQLGYFGGDPDNFTYPRYNLDVSFFRVYGPTGQPLATTHFFPWSTEGTTEGDAVFVVGNPGSTNRLATVSELVFERDYTLPQQLDALERRAALIAPYLEAHKEETEDADIRTSYLSMTNSIKATSGELEGLQDPVLIARKVAGENQLRRQLAEVDSLQERYGGLFQDLAEMQLSKDAVAPRLAAFSFFGTELGSHVLLRALYGYFYDTLRRRGVPMDDLADIKEEALTIEDWPAEVEEGLIALRLTELREVFGENDPTVSALLRSETPEEVAARVVKGTVLLDSTKFADIFAKGYLGSGDPTVELMDALAPLYFQYTGQLQSFQNREEILKSQLAQARFALYGTSIPPDASFSLRIADGVVKSYPYNGTRAPAYTTFYGLYNHFYSYKNKADWQLPARWLNPPPSFDLSTPFNLVTTNDITGGNSGSPLLNKDLELVGLVFDGNIESLPNTYLYTDETARTVAVDARGILEALDEIYHADRLVRELTGQGE